MGNCSLLYQQYSKVHVKESNVICPKPKTKMDFEQDEVKQDLKPLKQSIEFKYSSNGNNSTKVTCKSLERSFLNEIENGITSLHNLSSNYEEVKNFNLDSNQNHNSLRNSVKNMSIFEDLNMSSLINEEFTFRRITKSSKSSFNGLIIKEDSLTSLVFEREIFSSKSSISSI